MNKIKVLVVDDETSAQFVAGALLESRGCQIQSALNGRVAMKLMMNTNYDLVVLDWEMPDLKGSETMLEAQKLFRQWHKNFIQKRIPLVLYTSVPPEILDLPHVECFQLIDYWNKRDGLYILNKQAENVVGRLARRKYEAVRW
jgi:CheY-like chemotaxis protein